MIIFRKEYDGDHKLVKYGNKFDVFDDRKLAIQSTFKFHPNYPKKSQTAIQ
jgi:hypothetical protein